MFILFRPCSLLIGRCHSFPCSVHWIISSNILDGGCVTAKRSSRASRRCHVVISGCSSETVCTCDSGTLKIPRGSPPKISVFPACLKYTECQTFMLHMRKTAKFPAEPSTKNFFRQMSIMLCLWLVWAHTQYIQKYSFKSHFIIEQCNKEGNF